MLDECLCWMHVSTACYMLVCRVFGLSCTFNFKRHDTAICRCMQFCEGSVVDSVLAVLCTDVGLQHVCACVISTTNTPSCFCLLKE